MKHLFIFILYIKIILSDSHLMLTVFPIGKNIMKLENESLNLTCKVMSEDNSNTRFNLTWKLPARSNAYKGRVEIYENYNNELTVTINNLQDDDSGPYICELANNGIVRTKKISVFVKSKRCDEFSFDCGNGICIKKLFACDGHIDCPSGFDESFKHCGLDACYNKILCDGRCIPKEFCCDPFVEENCTANYLMPCCQRALYPNHLDLESPQCKDMLECKYGQMIGVRNSMIFIVATCALVIMIISGIILFLACRICTQHSENRWTPGSCDRFSHCHPEDHVDRDTMTPLNNSNIYNGRNLPTHFNSESESADDFVLVEFIDGIGYQIADCRPKPPPYTENTFDIPPPPYESRSDIANINEISISESLFPEESILNSAKQ